MSTLQGKAIMATEALNDTYFENARILITRQDHKGCSGFVINKKFSRQLNELQEFSYAAAIDLYEGGPVDTEHLYFIHHAPQYISGGQHISDDLYFGGDFGKAVQLLSEGKLSISEVKIFIGYCGWDAGELEAEIEEGSWVLVTGD